MSGFADMLLDPGVGRSKRLFRSEKFCGDKWVEMGGFFSYDERAINAHAEALGGQVRLLSKTGEVVASWVDGKRQELGA